MKKLLSSLLATSLICCVAFAQSDPAAKNAGPIGPAVEMEPFVVKGDRILPNPEQWTYVKVPALVLQKGNANIAAPGYELLSNLNSSQIKVLVQELQLRQFAATYLWPMLMQALPRTPVYGVVDINRQKSESRKIALTSDLWEGDPIVATNVQPAPSSFSSAVNFGATGAQQFAAEYGLSQMTDMNEDMIVPDDTTTTVQQDTTDLTSRGIAHFERDEMVVRPLPDGYVDLATNGGPLAVLARAGEPYAGVAAPSMERFAATVSYALNQYALNTAFQTMPDWFVRGLSGLLGSTQVSHKSIEFARVIEDMAGRTMPKLSTLLTKAGAFTEEEARLAFIFVHFGLFGDNGKYAARFLQFVDRIANGEKADEAMFKQVFGRSMHGMETYLAVYSRDLAAFKSREFKGIPEMFPPTYREATQSEVARIKAEMNVSQRDLVKALEELRTAYWRGERDPAMLALLATLEQQAGSEPRARKIIKALLELPKPPPQTYIAAARLQLKDTLAAKPAAGDGKLTAEETSALIATLSGALAGGLTTEDMCGTLAEIVLQSDAPPDSNMLAFLQQAAKRFPKNQNIIKASGV